MGKIRLVLLFAGVLMVTAWAASLAQAEIEQDGNLRIVVNGKLSPHRLPRNGSAPVSVSVEGKVSTTDGTEPPPLRKLTIQINRHGRIENKGLPICKLSSIRTASNRRALASCRPSLVGQGKFFGTITLPGSAPYPIKGRLLVFNGKEHGHSVLLGHIYSPHPFATSFVISFQISNRKQGEYGTTLTADLAKTLGSQRNLTGLEMTLSRRYSYKGKSRSYVSAGCPAPKGFNSIPFPLAKTTFSFSNGQVLSKVLNKTCEAKG